MDQAQMNSAFDRPCRILVTAEGRIPTVDLTVMYPLSQLVSSGQCEVQYRDVGQISQSDLHWCDILWVVRGAATRMLATVKCAKRLKRFVITYWDDDAFHITPWSVSYDFFTNPQVLDNIRAILGRSDLLTCSTAPLAEELKRQSGKTAHLLPVPAIEPVKAPPLRNNQPLRIGYAGSTDHQVVLEKYIVPALTELLQKGRTFIFEVMGPQPLLSETLDPFTQIIPHTQTYTQWIQARNHLQWDIALAPQEETIFSASKYHNKHLEMSAVGLPTILSRINTYRDFVRDGVDGILTDNTPHAWAAAIELLMDNPELRKKIAINAWNKICHNYSLAAVGESFRQQLQEAMKYRAPEIRSWVLPRRILGWTIIRWSMFSALGPKQVLQRLAQRLRLSR